MTAVGRPDNGQDEGRGDWLLDEYARAQQPPPEFKPVITCQPSPARWVTLPGDDRQHRSSNDCPCTPIVWPGGAVEHR